MPRLWIAFVPYIAVSLIHVAALAVHAEAIAGPTKLLLMPLLAVAVVWGARGSQWTRTHTLLVAAISLIFFVAVLIIALIQRRLTREKD